MFKKKTSKQKKTKKKKKQQKNRPFPTNIYLLKANNTNNRKRCELC